jgi:hypothetical protein
MLSFIGFMVPHRRPGNGRFRPWRLERADFRELYHEDASERYIA